MKRIYIGNATIDVSDEVGALVAQVHKELSDRRYTRGKHFGHGVVSEAFAVGVGFFEEIDGYVNDAADAVTASVWLGAGNPMVIAPHFPAKTDPSGSHLTAERLRQYLDDEDSTD